MRRILYFFVIFFTSFNVLFAQENVIEKANEDYFKLPRESIFLHLNKSTYVVGEELWFKGYIYDRKNNTSSKATSNIYVGIYDSIGNQIDKKLYLGYNGYTRGNFPIDSIFTSGNYYIKASTNWMKNFAEDDAFVQKIKIINKNVPKTSLTEVKYDLQLLAEGGHIIQNTLHTVGFKIVDQQGFGKPIQKGEVIDNTGKSVVNFKSNVLGMGKFSINPLPGKNYTVKVQFNDGTIIEKPLTQISSQGIVLGVNNLSKTNVIVALKTNSETLKNIVGKKYKLLIHKNGVSKTADIEFDKDKTEILTLFKRENLFSGVNIITLFDDKGTPLLERLFFNPYGLEFPEVSISNNGVEDDSLKIKLKIATANKKLKSFSISVLPENTLSYNQSSNIQSEFLLKPYLRGNIENSSYYFKDIDRRKEYDLDLLLLTQGWSRYEWNRIFNQPPKEMFPFENGITLIGRFNDPKIGDFPQFYISSSKNSNTRILDLKGPEIKISNLFPETDEEIRIALIKKNGDFIRPKMSANFITNKSIDKVIPFSVNSGAILNNETENLDRFLSDEVISLNEVVVTEKAKNQTISNFGSLNSLEITEKEVFQFPFITDYIQFRGYFVDDFSTPGQVIIRSRRPTNFSGTPLVPLVFFNDVPLSDFSILYRLRTEEVERIVVNQQGFGLGVRGAGGQIKIWGRSTPLNTDRRKQLPFYTADVTEAFNPSKKFYTPKYASYFDKTFERYGVIHWAPDVVTDENGEAVFKILNTTLKDIVFYIEGMGEDGSLISSVKILNQ